MFGDPVVIAHGWYVGWVRPGELEVGMGNEAVEGVAPGYSYCGCHGDMLATGRHGSICSRQIMWSHLCFRKEVSPIWRIHESGSREPGSSFLKQILIELLWCTRHHSRSWDTALNKTRLFLGRESQQEIYDIYTTKYMIYKYVICNYVIHMYIGMYVSYDERWE